MDMVMLWNTALTILLSIAGWAIQRRDKEMDGLKEEQSRLNILLNRTREEVAKEYVTKQEVHADINRVLDRFDKLEEKLDRVIGGHRGA
jgi:hypothetical protein